MACCKGTWSKSSEQAHCMMYQHNHVRVTQLLISTPLVPSQVQDFLRPLQESHEGSVITVERSGFEGAGSG